MADPERRLCQLIIWQKNYQKNCMKEVRPRGRANVPPYPPMKIVKSVILFGPFKRTVSVIISVMSPSKFIIVSMESDRLMDRRGTDPNLSVKRPIIIHTMELSLNSARFCQIDSISSI